MKVLRDECVPKRLARLLPGHEVRTVPQMGWAGVRNGRLLSLAGGAPFDVLITVDWNMEHQHNVATLPVAVVLEAPSNDIDDLVPLAPAILSALAGLAPNSFTHVGRVP